MLHIESVKVDDHGIWLQPKQLIKKFSLSRATLYRLMAEMREDPNYAESVLDLSQTLHLVNLEDFFQFLKSKDKRYLRA